MARLTLIQDSCQFICFSKAHRSRLSPDCHSCWFASALGPQPSPPLCHTGTAAPISRTSSLPAIPAVIEAANFERHVARAFPVIWILKAPPKFLCPGNKTWFIFHSACRSWVPFWVLTQTESLDLGQESASSPATTLTTSPKRQNEHPWR